VNTNNQVRCIMLIHLKDNAAGNIPTAFNKINPLIYHLENLLLRTCNSLLPSTAGEEWG